MKLKFFAPALCLALLLSLLAGCGGGKTPDTSDSPEPTNTTAESPQPTESASSQGEEINFAVLKGPTGVGAAKLLADNEAGETVNHYNVTIASDPATEISPKLINGELDIAAISTNLASTLYHKTEGGVQLLALNTLGVLYILENGDSVSSLSDLAGRTIYATGQGANPEYVLNYLLRENGLEPGTDVTIEWKASDELTTLMASGQIDLCMLPVPAATAVQAQNAEVRPGPHRGVEQHHLRRCAHHGLSGGTHPVRPGASRSSGGLPGGICRLHRFCHLRSGGSRSPGGPVRHHRQRTDRFEGHSRLQPGVHHRQRYAQRYPGLL